MALYKRLLSDSPSFHRMLLQTLALSPGPWDTQELFQSQPLSTYNAQRPLWTAVICDVSEK